MNKLTLTGKLTKDAECKYTSNNKSIASLNIYEEDEKTFLDITCWEDVADSVKNLVKDDVVTIEGYVKKRSYEDNYSHKKIYVTEVLALSVIKADTPYNEGDVVTIDGQVGTVSTKEVSPYDFIPKEVDPFADFGESVSIDDTFLD